MLQKDGGYALRKIIEASVACPIQGLYGLSTFQKKIWDLYDGCNFEQPVETGWPVLNEFYKVVPGELTIVTGVLLLCVTGIQAHVQARSPASHSLVAMYPLCLQRTEAVGPSTRERGRGIDGEGGAAGVPNTGKSEFVDALVLSLAQNHFWPICFASFEKLTHQHFSTLAEKVWGKPFKRREGYSGPLMTEKEVCPMHALKLLWSCTSLLTVLNS